jgi:hypothetical protein
MQGESALTVVAEVALGLAGFTGIVMALSRSSDFWHDWDAYRAFLLLLSGLGAFILSLVPFSLHFFGISEPSIWRICSAVMIVYSGLVLVVGWRAALVLPREDIPYWGAVAWFANLGAGANILTQLTNLWSGVPSLFFAGLLWMLLYASVSFGLILYVRPRNRGGA